MYETRADQLGYGHDYSPAGGEPSAAYAGAPAAPLAVVAGERGGADRDVQPKGSEAATNRGEFFQAVNATGLAALLDLAGRSAVRLSAKLGSSNLSPATIEQLELRVASFVQRYDHTPLGQLFAEVFARIEEVEALLDGGQPLRQRRGLYRIAGQLSLLLGLLSFELGDYPAAQTQLLTALQLAREVGDHPLTAWVRMNQSTVALWAGDFRGALDYAQDGQRYATGGMSARLAVRGEACAYARMSERSGTRDALQRAERALPSQPDSGDGWWVFALGSFQLYTGSSLLWLGDAAQAEPHMRQAVAWYQTAPLTLQNPANLAQAQINLAICLVGQDQPEEGIRLAAEALRVERVHVEPNLQQANEFLAALKPAHRNLPTAHDLVEQLRSIRAARPAPSPG